ncbi:polyribonucleotide nucleotidyltransferase [Propionibacterium freudenreichii]|uniref:polyribonucleotide nucleotidyltransferase n=1 Tax=Propionibacterium freudenreichii TaxID=1744 RepID=UPI00254D17E3|nr:polyribonucleotide nucleotidyltransferase [Propionibacterium freudenreichii]MDK9658914.1 polyribonucleotide nucleotidyltransferase [Propionibacterium freudenreichii]
MEGPDIKFSEAIIDNGKFGKHIMRFETGLLAQQADGAAAVYLDGDSMLLSTTTAQKKPREAIDFFPLTVDVEEKMYAVGRIPGSFFRREGRPSENAILTCRLIDRPLRPAFKKGLRNEVQVVVTVLALNPQVEYDMVAMNAASMSTQISGLPFSGPIGAVRISLIGDQWVCLPTVDQEKDATFSMVVAGRVLPDGDIAIMMVEAGGTEATWELVKGGRTAPTEEVVAAGLDAAKPFIKVLCDAQAELAAQVNKETYDFPVFKEYEDDVWDRVKELGYGKLDKIEQVAAKLDRQEAESDLKHEIVGQMVGEEDFEGREGEIAGAFKALEKKIVRDRVLSKGVRIDGRGPKDIRALSSEVGVVPRVHGSGLFQRGETQVLGITTLNILDMEQKLDTLSSVHTKRYMHQYEMPPYSTGETGRVGSPKRREVGHGALASRAIVPVLPTREEFPYAIRQVSEAIGSNGSTSMGSVCASTLSLLNAGVPLKAPVAGIAMGLMSETDESGKTSYLALTDILGAEDALGDMDFKVAGTSEFVTALQLDTKLNGIPADVLAAALLQARDARHAILDVIHDAIDSPDEMSPYAPRIITVHIPTDKIGEVIGPKGKVINQIQDDTGANISIEEDGTIYVGADNGDAAEAARTMINAIANPTMPERGERYLGTVVKLTSFGAFISLLPGKDGLLHISKLRALNDGKRVENVEDVLSVGQKLQVEISDIDDRGKLSLVPVLDEDDSDDESDDE